MEHRLSFQIEDRKAGRKTDAWKVWNLHTAVLVGEIVWIKSVRKYGFREIGGRPVDCDCLRELATFCDLETRRHIVGLRAFSE